MRHCYSCVRLWREKQFSTKVEEIFLTKVAERKWKQQQYSFAFAVTCGINPVIRKNFAGFHCSTCINTNEKPQYVHQKTSTRTPGGNMVSLC